MTTLKENFDLTDLHGNKFHPTLLESKMDLYGNYLVLYKFSWLKVFKDLF